MKQRRITEVAALRHVLQIKRRLQLEMLASISKLLREHEVNATDDLLASLVLAVPEELMDDNSSTLASLRLASNMATKKGGRRPPRKPKKMPKPQPAPPQKAPKPQPPPQKAPKPQPPPQRSPKPQPVAPGYPRSPKPQPVAPGYPRPQVVKPQPSKKKSPKPQPPPQAPKSKKR